MVRFAVPCDAGVFTLNPISFVFPRKKENYEISKFHPKYPFVLFYRIPIISCVTKSFHAENRLLSTTLADGLCEDQSFFEIPNGPLVMAEWTAFFYYPEFAIPFITVKISKKINSCLEEKFVYEGRFPIFHTLLKIQYLFTDINGTKTK